MTQPTLRALLGRRDLRLRLVPFALAEDALDRPLRWVHSSDLGDPTPFLADDLALLTTGTQFADEDAASIDAYISRLAERGVVGLGFGTEVQRAGIPERLIVACERAHIPLFEVPYDTPFIAVARAHSEAIAAQTYARRTWALDTQRALAIAALRPNGLESTLSELARRLERWVGMFDATGLLVHQHPHRPPAETAALASRATELVARGGHASQSLTLEPESFTLFTLGATGHLRGVIAIGATGLDAETRTVVTSVIAMAGLALEQNDRLSKALQGLHSQVLASLLLDDPTLALQVLGSLPAAPVVIGVASADMPIDAIADWWDRQRIVHGTAVFSASSDAGITVCVSAADQHLFDELAERFDIRLGVSEPEDYEAFSRAHDQATAALRHRGSGSDRPGAVRYADTVAASILSALATDEARLVAASRLAPLRAHGLEQSMRVWLEHDARFESAASVLGIHRHTLRSRVTHAARLLDTDLSTFPARAELWAALQTVGD